MNLSELPINTPFKEKVTETEPISKIKAVIDINSFKCTEIAKINIKNSKKSKNRCFSCKRKLKIFEIEFKCKCSYKFCCKHKLPFNHKCTYQAQRQHENRELIKENNKMIVKDKVIKF
jgi:hypothetical protein